MYCGAEIPEAILQELGLGEAAGESLAGSPDSSDTGADDERSPRKLLVVDLAATPSSALGQALGLGAYEAELFKRRGGYHLHRVLEETAASEELRRLRAGGVTVEDLPEAEARVKPLRAIGGDCGWGFLTLRTEEEPLTLRRRDLLIIISGPIARQYQPVYRRRRVEVASLEEGYRVHFHRRADPRPVEIDGGNFEFGFTVTGSTRLELDAWVEAVGKNIQRDEGFRRIPPAFGIAEPEARGRLAAATALGRTSRARRQEEGGEPVILDNGAQFAFYSGWRAAIERRRAG